MSTHRGYANVVETLGETKKELDEELVNELKDRFTVVRFDEDMESVLPYVARIVSEMNNTSRISETFGEFKEAVGSAREIQVKIVEADHPGNPANLVFDNVTKKNQHIINFMAEHILDENIQTLMKQVAIDYPRYDIPMKNESLVIVKSIMETGQTPKTASQDTPMEETFIDEIDESLSKYVSNDIFFERHVNPQNAEEYYNNQKKEEEREAEDKEVRRKEWKWRKAENRHEKAKRGGTSVPRPDHFLHNHKQGERGSPQVVKDGIGEADEAVLKLAGVYK
jgi:hypothetical protein